MSPVASVIVPSHGGAARLPVLFEALQRQEGPSYECLVVVDGDVDGSAQVIEQWRSRIPLRGIVFDANQGRSAALNAGHEAATGDVLIRCDDDLAPASDFVAQHVATHESGPVGAVGMCLDVFGDTAYGRAYGDQARESMRALTYSLAPDLLWRRWGANVSVTREQWQRIGPYDTRFTQYGWEDIDWGYRLHRAGVPIVVRRELEVAHLNPAPTAAQRARKAYLSGRSRAVFVDKHGPVLTDAVPVTSPWNAAVRGLAATMRSERAVRIAGSPVDALLPHLPPTVGRKLAALLIESAGAASLSGGPRSSPRG